MKRRGFLGSILAGGAALLPIQSSGQTEKPREQDPNDPFEYRGYRIIWTGWKSAYDSPWLVGQWLAVPIVTSDEWSIYVNLPGLTVSKYRAGHVFDISGRGERVSLLTPESERADIVRSGLKTLLGFIDAIQDARRP